MNILANWDIIFANNIFLSNNGKCEKSRFDLDENYKPKKVAGVPPDYFCAEGQLWGNPLYNYDEMRKDNFRWFCNRIERMFKLYDKLRIDHFRAFDRYWAVEYGAKNAIEGEWCKGIGRELFAIVRHKFPKADIIAEDLGVIDDGVIDLRERTGFPGMRVLQFAFDSEVSPHMPHNYESALPTQALTTTPQFMVGLQVWVQMQGQSFMTILASIVIWKVVKTAGLFGHVFEQCCLALRTLLSFLSKIWQVGAKIRV